MSVHFLPIVSKRMIAQGTLEVRFRLEGRVKFEPGQYARVAVPLRFADGRGPSRDFSIASSPQDDRLMIAFRVSKSGFKRTLSKLPLGARVQIEGPFGVFALPRRGDVVFVAGGIGITPFMSMLRDAQERKVRRKFVLFYANRSRKSAAFLPELKSMRFLELHSIFRRLTAADLKKHITKKRAVWLVCGRPGMVGAVRKLLLELGVSEQLVRIEEFVGY